MLYLAYNYSVLFYYYGGVIVDMVSLIDGNEESFYGIVSCPFLFTRGRGKGSKSNRPDLSGLFGNYKIFYIYTQHTIPHIYLITRLFHH